MASIIAAAVQRIAMDGERQCLTFRQTRRTVPMTFSMMFVQASERRNSRGRPSLRDGEHFVEPFQDRPGDAVPVGREATGEVAQQLLGLGGVVQLPDLPQHAAHRGIVKDLGNRSRMLRAL